MNSMKNHDKKKRGKSCTSGLGEERIKQHEANLRSMEAINGRKTAEGTGAIDKINDTYEGQVHKDFGQKAKKRDINMIDYDAISKPWKSRGNYGGGDFNN